MAYIPKREKRRNALIVIVGPTASGKSDMAIKLARFFNGEVISADSRQVYKGMDIGSGKVTKKEMKGISHHLLSIVSPKKSFSVARYQKLAIKKIRQVLKRNKLPILCGGSGFYIQAVVDGILFPNVPPSQKLRNLLEKKSTSQLYKILLKIDPKRAKNIDKKNPRRLIRAIEIAKNLGAVPPITKKPLPYPTLMIGIEKSKEELKQLIKERLKRRLRAGLLIEEVKKLRKSGLSWKKLDQFGLEYRWVAKYLKREIKFAEMVEKLQKDIERFAKRQMIWFKKDKRIIWVKNYKKAKKIISFFLHQKKERRSYNHSSRKELKDNN